ncbi:hypothetical protein LAZ67_11001900 [Cordylochernes scorpioides]|uniref:Transposase n=1 Tax=Cordylochernes scorpioides TaxID=51811 RepID=A0ABY6KYT1_9ARAC|nr:hypothetical protein LAZ67_11001900 [Cordylochernes scorpioides]
MVCTIKSWSNKQEKARMLKSKLNCLLITLFDVKGLLHYEFVPECQTINQHYYLDVLRRLKSLCVRKRLHTAVTVQLYLAKHGIALLPQPPYSPDLAPNNFFLHPKIERVLKGPLFDSIPEIKENSKNILKSLKDEDFQRCFDIWKKRWNKCIDMPTAEQKQQRVDVCREMLNELENNPNFLDNVVTGDESWTFQYDPETKAQSSEWHTSASPRPKKAMMSKSRVETMLIVFFDKRGLIHKEFVTQGKTVNAEFYKEVLRRLHKAAQDHAQLWRLHHDNAPAHTAFLVTSYLTRIGVEVLPQPPYSPDMSPPDFFLFLKVKRCLKGNRFDDIPNIQRTVTKALTGITPTDYSGDYEAWKTRWQRCVDAQGDLFEEY